MGGERCGEARARRRKPPDEVSLSLLGLPGSGEAEMPVRASRPSMLGLATFESGWMVPVPCCFWAKLQLGYMEGHYGTSGLISAERPASIQDLHMWEEPHGWGRMAPVT